MAYEQKPGQGSIFKNDKKTEEKHPDYKGSLTTEDNIQYWVSGWVKKTDGKDPFLSLSIQKKEQQPNQAAATPFVQPELPESKNNDLPF